MRSREAHRHEGRSGVTQCLPVCWKPQAIALHSSSLKAFDSYTVTWWPHLDLKPANIVIGAKNKLWIIDFNVSVRVPLLESRIRGYQGTKGWVAPEVEQNPDAGYEPIRADLWSTGQVMRHLAEHQPANRSEMIFLADQLQNSE